MKLIVTAIIISGVLYVLHWWFTDYQNRLDGSVDTPAGFENGITTPINSAEEARNALEDRY